MKCSFYSEGFYTEQCNIAEETTVIRQPWFRSERQFCQADQPWGHHRNVDFDRIFVNLARLEQKGKEMAKSSVYSDVHMNTATWSSCTNTGSYAHVCTGTLVCLDKKKNL